MKDLIIGMIIGVITASLCFSLILQQNQITTLKAKQESLCKDIDNIMLRIGPLFDKVKTKKK